MNLIHWVSEHPYQFVLIFLVLSTFTTMMWAIRKSKSVDLQALEEDMTDHPITKIAESNAPVTWIKLYAGCLGNCTIFYHFTAGTPTLKGSPNIYSNVEIVKVVLQNGLTMSDSLLPVMTTKQVRLLCYTVYKAHEQKELAQTELNN